LRNDGSGSHGVGVFQSVANSARQIKHDGAAAKASENRASIRRDTVGTGVTVSAERSAKIFVGGNVEVTGTVKCDEARESRRHRASIRAADALERSDRGAVERGIGLVVLRSQG